MTVTDIQERLDKNEWLYLIDKYPQVAFNYRNFDGSYNSRERGFRILYTAEPYIGMPEQWDYEMLKQYDGVITFNRKFINDHQDRLNMKLVHGCLACNAYYQLDSFKSYEERVPGVCVLNKLYHVGRPGEIVGIRDEFVRQIRPELPVHIWSQMKWGGARYKGPVNSPIHHSHITQLQKINEYRFCFCPESSYHEYWTWDFMTERMFNCFKSKTVPIYIGCYNIEEHVPKDLFIDFREFYGDYNRLTDYLLSFPQSQWEDMTERAFEWNKTNRIGNVEDLEATINEFSL
jgi:hypothetical protein